MAQPFDCLCGKPTCRGRIAGARDMTSQQLGGLWLNGHIHELLLELKEQPSQALHKNGTTTSGVAKQQNGNGRDVHGGYDDDATAAALRDALGHAERGVEAARRALQAYAASSAAGRRGPTSRELSGEMGGDTRVAV